MSVAVKKIEGVESVKVSLNEGRATIVLKPGNTVRLDQIRKAVEEQGFTPKDAKVKAIGNLSGPNGHLQFTVSGSNEVFPVRETPHAPWRHEARSNVAVSGFIAAPRTARETSTIHITEMLTNHDPRWAPNL